MYGLGSCALDLIASFLTNRRQAVYQDTATSSLMPIKFGVPQGSVLGPILFSIYINDLPVYISSCCELFADDTTIHESGKDVNLVCDALQYNLNKLVFGLN